MIRCELSDGDLMIDADDFDTLLSLDEALTKLEQEDAELDDMSRRFWIGLALTIPLFAMTMAEMFGLSLNQWVAPQVSGWLQLALATPVVLWAGWPFFERGWRSIVNRSLNMFTLIAIGTGAAYFYSLVAVLFCFVPFLAAYSELDASMIWVASSTSMAMTMLIHFAVASRLIWKTIGGDAFRGVIRGEAQVLSPGFVGLLFWGTLLAIVVQVLNCLGIVFDRGILAYLVGLLWYVVVAALFFIRLVVSGIRGNSAGRA